MVAAAEAIVNGPRMSSRERVLERISKANSKAAGPPESIPRGYDCGSTQSTDETVALFESRPQAAHRGARRLAEGMADGRLGLDSR